MRIPFGPLPSRQRRGDRRDVRARERLVRRVRSEFDEMRGMHLTERQAVRLFGLDPAACRRILHALVHAGFLVRTSRGSYARRTS